MAKITACAAPTEWNDDTTLRFIEGVEITEAGVSVRFKAGVSVEVELPEKAGSL